MNLGLPKCRPLRSPLVFAIIAAILLVALYNWRFWHETVTLAKPSSAEDLLFLLSLFLILVFAHAGVLLLMPNPRTMKVAAATAFAVAAATAFFIDSYNVVIDREMIRNLFETDRQEAGAFIVPRLGLYLLLLGFIPAVIASRAKLIQPPLRQRLMQRFGFFAIALAVTGSATFSLFPHYASFFSEHKTGRLLNPAQPIAAVASYVRSEFTSGPTLFVDDPKSRARSLAAAMAGKPLLLFLVVGETARAMNFQLGGYARPTNPELATVPRLYYFDNVQSCGTSTAVSVPCIFSPRGHEDSVSYAQSHSNLVDALSSAGVNVEWRENNSNSKGVAIRVKTVDFVHDPQAAGCDGDVCNDESMNSGLATQLEGLRSNSVIVFHDLGSHGPAYWRRYPPSFEKFKPVCRTSELWTCSKEALVNTYDNTILYTDHVLAQQIRLLQQLSDVADSLLIYVSDHGESLGEHGLYLHGAPYGLAPAEQTRVPLLIWASDGYRRRFSLDESCIQNELHRPLTHDNIYHTVLGAIGVRNAYYRKRLDLLGSCWGSGREGRH